MLLVDDAHGVGVVGDEGRGSCAAQAVRPELLVVTFGKAFGVSGAAVLCDEAMADYLLQLPSSDLTAPRCARPGVALSAAWGSFAAMKGSSVATSWPPASVSSVRGWRGVAGVDRLRQRDPAADRRRHARALNLACRLRDAGCWATAIRPPTVPVGSARLRLTLTAAHHAEDINRLLEVLHGHSE